MANNDARILVGVASVLLIIASCLPHDVTDPPGDNRATTLLVRADVSAAAVATMVAEVTAPDIPKPLVFNIPIANGAASGVITLPAGSNRTVTLRAFDAGGVETHRGSVTATIQAGTNPTIVIVLSPLAGDVPINATLGSFFVTVTPGVDTMAIGATTALTATIVDGEGVPVAESVVWASLDPDIASVASTGARTAQVTTRTQGTTSVIASFGGGGGAASILVWAATKQLLVSGLNNPLYLTQPPGDTTRLFVVEQPGQIKVIHNGVLLATPFLDLTTLVSFSGERGLLSMAFHPNYATNGYFYVNYTMLHPDSLGDTRVARYTVSADLNIADPASAKPILFVEQPYENHNGGLLKFGPDGKLYIGMGDGGSGGDPENRAQNLDSLLGKLLRLDVDVADPTPYAIPPDNPFEITGVGRGEIWAYGLRNPWRFAFDRLTNELYIADVGQGAREEINVAPAGTGGQNYGWRIMEGTICHNPPVGCSQAGLVLPVIDYDHTVTGGCSITGGYVYRGDRLPTLLRGHYFYGDFCRGWVRSFRYANGVVTGHHDYSSEFGVPGRITSFGEDTRGELYIVTQQGSVYRIVPFP